MRYATWFAVWAIHAIDSEIHRQIFVGRPAACQKGLSVGSTTTAALVHELMETRDDRQLLRSQKRLAGYKLLIIDELGCVPLSKTGAEFLFEVFSQRYEQGSVLVTSNLGIVRLNRLGRLFLSPLWDFRRKSTFCLA